ncbi:5-formyltetrahydrofolate cyclo-ligase [Domibacillus iocasae]|uniref:5-formyltetrahydrofolate cyclo-ligase n=1 Tax=Domibacillus iocasae TaxID=1714016 RepID=A0A1E7DNV3_9BACI|nr:5-formyltetrahydrofolate cyclo-ligase [Domibacillus iocasae]OES44368.1 5-formyltetrahydrofolate cyclo-ligase [Domibacillus iocasae]
MNKKKMRETIKQQLTAMERPVYEQKSFDIAAKLYALAEWKQAKIIALTVSADFEVDTWQLIRFAWLNGKIVCVPKCSPDTKSMQFYQLERFSDLEKVYAGLYEPNPEKTTPIHSNELDLLVVPGLLFERKGFRIGFGGGYYDRFLSSYKGQTISLAFSIQLLEKLPVEKYDMPVQKIVTDKEIIIC